MLSGELVSENSCSCADLPYVPFRLPLVFKPIELRELAVVNRVDDGVILLGGFDARSIRGGKSGTFPSSRVDSRLLANKALSCVATASVVSSSVPLKLNLLSIVERRKLWSYGF